MGDGINAQVARWNGQTSDFTPNGSDDWVDVGTGVGYPTGLADGDVIAATYDASSGAVVIRLHLNGRPVFSVKDTGPRAIRTGAPGMGFFWPGQDEVVEEYADRFFSSVREVFETRDHPFARS